MEETTIRGFLYWDNSHWVVADQPNLKSCCLPKQGTVILEGDFSAYETDKPLSFQGTLSSNHHLSNAMVLEESPVGFPFFTLGAVIGVFLLVAFFLRRPLKK